MTISSINIFDRAGVDMTRPRHTATGVPVGLISEFELEASGGDSDIGAEKDSGLGDTT